MRLKQEYNYWLNRFYKGCQYLEKNDAWNKYGKTLLNFLDLMNEYLKLIPNATEEEILNGFTIK